MGKARYRVELSPSALRDLEEIISFIAADNPEAAERFGQRLIEQARAAALHPLAGRMVPELRDKNIREKIVRSYRIVYRVDKDHRVLVVFRFWHAARGTPMIESSDDPPPLR